MMKNYVTLKSVVSVFAALAMSLAAVSVTAQEINIENDGQDYIGRIIVITDPRSSSSTHCGIDYDEYKAVIINPGGGPALVTSVGVDQNVQVKAGDRFTIDGTLECNGRLKVSTTRN